MNTAAAVENFDAGVAALGIIDGGRADKAQALRYFMAATDADPQMCDAWLGRILCGNNDSSAIYQAWKCQNQMHEQLARLGVPAGLFLPRIDIGMGIVALEYAIYDRGVLGIALALTQAMGNPPDYEEALDTLRSAPGLPLARWVRAAMYYRAQRWPDVIDTLSEDERGFDRDQVLKVGVHTARGVAHAFLGELDAAERYLRQVVDAEDKLPTAKPVAQWFLALIARERGEEDAAVALMRQVNTTAPSADVDAAIGDSTIRLKMTSREAVAARSDAWDPASGPDAAELAGQRAAEQRAALLAQATEELDAQIGMAALKEQIKTFRARIRMAEKRRELGLKTPGAANHMVFVGPPGTGKTTVARIIAKILCGLGIVGTSNVKEVSAKNLIGQYVGQSEALTSEKIKEAMDGVLFIDEAYALVPKKTAESNAGVFGEAVVDTLLTHLENDRERLVVIIAGYEDDIDRLLDTNEGLRSRFAHRFGFDTYSPKELVEIAEVLAAGRDDALDADADQQLLSTCEHLADTQIRNRRAIDAVGNGRFVRKVLEAAADFRDLRNEEDPPDVLDEQAIMTIRGPDISAALSKVLAAESTQAGTDLTVLAGER